MSVPVATVRGAASTASDTLPRRAAPALAAVAVRALGRTLRVRTAGIEPLVPLWTTGRPLIYVLWHGRILMAPWINAQLRRGSGARPVTVLASRSRDGELVARYVARFGLSAVRGSSSRGGAAAVRALAGLVRAGEDVVVVPDGPRGPAARVQAGVVLLAILTGAPIVPLAFAAHPAVRLSTWDRFVVPVPFSRAAIVLGAPLVIAPGDDRERARRTIEAALEDTTARADAMAAGW